MNNVLDVDKLGDADGTVQIIAMDTNKFKIGDLVFIRIKGTPVEGPPIDWEPSAGVKLESVPSIMEIMAPNAVLRQLAKSQITLSYRLEKPTAPLNYVPKASSSAPSAKSSAWPRRSCQMRTPGRWTRRWTE